MDQDAFKAGLRARGYETFLTREWAPGLINDTHSHEFSAAALVLDGEIRIETAEETCICRPGDTFELGAGIPHKEIIGPQGVKFLVGRK